MTLPHEVYLAALREESERFLEALAGVDPTAAVPTCTGWTAADLLWHLGEVQQSWAEVAAHGPEGGEPPEVARPDADDLATSAATAGTALLAALSRRGPSEPCWSWHEDGGTVGWVARRQAHEALVHRVDAQLTAGVEVTPPAVELAADGVDEVLRVMVDGVPAWGTFTPDGVTVRLVAENAGASWVLALGRFTGTSPGTGTAYDLDAAAVLAEDDGGSDDLVVTGHAWDLDLWLWGRSGAAPLTVEGDPAVLERLRTLLAEATQ